MNNQAQTPVNPQPGQEQRRKDPDHIESEHEQHPQKLRQVSQEDMQKIMPPNTDPDDPQSP